jgi:hypothetical protein
MFRKLTLAAVFINSLVCETANTCTVWGAITPNDLIIGKNRDFYPGSQRFKTINDQGKYRFFGLYGANQSDVQATIKMGINQAGVVVFMTFASTIPLKQRTAKIPYYTVMENILANYSDVDSIYRAKKQLFKDSTPINYVFADRNKALLCEIGLNNDYKCQIYNRNKPAVVTFAQTNHYILHGLQQYNLTPKLQQQTSYFRLNKINELMQANLAELSLTKFIEFSFNTEAVNDNPLAKFDEGYANTYQDNSILRTFNSHPDRKNNDHVDSDQGVSSMLVELPRDKKRPIELYLRIIDQINDVNDAHFTQKIYYSETRTTLNTAINTPESIVFNAKSCLRNLTSKTCKAE